MIKRSLWNTKFFTMLWAYMCQRLSFQNQWWNQFIKFFEFFTSCLYFASGIWISAFCHCIGLLCDIVCSICFALSSANTGITNIWSFWENWALGIVVSWTKLSAIVFTTSYTTFGTFLYPTQTFYFAFSRKAAVFSARMFSQSKRPVESDFSRNTSRRFSDFLCNLT